MQKERFFNRQGPLLRNIRKEGVGFIDGAIANGVSEVRGAHPTIVRNRVFWKNPVSGGGVDLTLFT